MQKLEEVARAIYEADDPWASAFPWPKLKEGEPRADEYRRVARAAIEAMRVPTPGMVDAHFEAHAKADTFFASAEDVFNAMIDAALKEDQQC